MADDIQIKGMNPQTDGQNAQQTAGTTGVGGQTAQTPVAGATQPAQNSGDQGLNPVIDLRNIDQKPAAQNGAAPVQAVPAAPAVEAQPAASAAANPRRANAIMLGDDEPMQAPGPADKYAIPAMVKEKFPDLVQLIKETESMNDEERDYWFQILPIMTEDQIKKFRDILVNEKEQLSHLDQEYEQELNKLNEKHMIEWKDFETKEKRKSLTAAEQTSKAQEQSEEEDLLKRLSQV